MASDADDVAQGRTDVVATRAAVISAVRSPLDFFALALLIVEGFLVAAGTFFGLPLWAKISALGIGVVLFVVVLAIVRDLVVRHPTNLTFSEGTLLEFHRMMRIYGQDDRQLTGELLEAQVTEGPPEVPSIEKQPGVSDHGEDH
jgi:hypothetical protein